jgi:hypothetical protein
MAGRSTWMLLHSAGMGRKRRVHGHHLLGVSTIHGGVDIDVGFFALSHAGLGVRRLGCQMPLRAGDDEMAKRAHAYQETW